MKPDSQLRGAQWRIWDLHIHTPKSLVQNYGPDNDATWSRFIDELEALPKDVKVIGINDYWFLDGYRKVLEARAAGRLKNLEMIFPVVEMRLDQFGGTDGHLKRVNLHVVFDAELEADVIEAQFLAALSSKLSLTPGVSAPSWHAVITRESLAELGAQIKEGVPESEKANYGSDLIEGFNNLNVSIEAVRNALDNNFLRGRAVLGLGKTEWAAIKWNEQSIANKKSIVTEAKFLFTAYGDASRWSSQVASMKSAGVNHKILDCSDAHTWANDTSNKDRLGASSTWMNTTPSFAGLLHALEEFDQRVFVGLEPPALGRLQRNPERYIESVKIESSDTARANAFGYTLPINPGFVAIVGNKGQGKSALLDCIALAGNSSRATEFAFLTPQRFLSAANKSAKFYSVDLAWANGSSRQVPFGNSHIGSAPVQVEYLPQRYVERVCTTDPLSDESHEFEDELREVLFTHIPEDERAGETSFDALLASKTESAKNRTADARQKLRLEAERYAALSDFVRDNPTRDVESKLELKAREIEAAEVDLASARAELASSDATGSVDAETDALRTDSASTRLALKEAETERTVLLQHIGALQQAESVVSDIDIRVTTLEETAAAISREWEALSTVGQAEPLVTVVVKRQWLGEWRAANAERLKSARLAVQQADLKIGDLRQRASQLDNLLAAADSARELTRQRVLQVEDRLKSLRGDLDSEGSESWLSDLLEKSISAPKAIEKSQAALIDLARDVYSALDGELTAVTDLYGPASRYIAASDVVRNAGLEFKAELSVVSRLQPARALVDGRRSPELLAWLSELPERVTGQDWGDLQNEFEVAFRRLTHERGSESGQSRHPGDALRGASTAADFLVNLLSLDWVDVRFGLTGDGLPLAQLSPGQRGLVLALFYLIVDLRTTPLLLDQPEENLDNATIASLLVPAIQEAAGRRQTIIVTHNANLAIVGDADQIIHCTFSGGRFDVTSGCISELKLAESAVNVLEGTKPAFDVRRHKYEAFPSLV